MSRIAIGVLSAGMAACGGILPTHPCSAASDVTLGQYYSLTTMPKAGCPGLDWHVVVDADRQIDGFVAWDKMKHSAKLSGTLNTDDSFKMVGDEVGGTKKASITGNVTSIAVNFTITGTGTACDNQTFSAPRLVLGGGGGQ